ncbi:hypothetical protein PFAG_02001 [Plasmodium falciparum Santa Lucia]|uniref:Non-canonical E2 ubiquitin-conjugating enzyme C-terminal domain-containing protein n=22 Tax=Plasmodium falciparum TaxID=5833 RepID=C0H4U0_PLAF7|nr:conserved protein, unknown function [Plasmodium falciparum 3D7]ETW31206.1 hypothetical protein PFFCH_01358 [Plasmodium falciparum FCH/4]ETW37187.1 hypothetical protein PFTANZ_02119 [Plasmodium falciparum Tanzania (2000708)]ETW43254.1 hypothetical protein PFNF135_02168 [Plasmodium falciparum NF135/5.C10]ETW49873.1 hypothetical protein PFMALIP_02063 [Plasmodium falciparum MaliPS096_E11]ETW52546.1 hypothetical protein PFUGPA_05553 [Plasmodium falciparum Palo Alto/Uganda]ETW61908.1 hypothetica|eukprot:XP_002808839.1 conserved protein, unknown function [Plasmodium falciparum 3D7]
MNENDKLKNILDQKEETLIDTKEDDNLIENNIKEYENISKKNFEILKFLNKDELILLIDKLNKEGNLSAIIDQEIKQDTLDILKNFENEQYDTIELEDKDEKAENEEDEEEECYYMNMCKYIPLRLTYEERLYLRLLESTLEVSEYTDKIDILHSGNKNKKIIKEIKTLCSILSGLVIANNYENGQKLIRDRDFIKNSHFFSFVFEIGRRYKILNPDRMRSSYGKLMYFLMDTRKEDIYDLLSFDCVSPIKTVYGLLKERKNGFDLLKDSLIKIATMQIDGKGNRNEIQKQIKQKEDAIKYLARKYSNDKNNKKNLFRINIPIFNSQTNTEEDTNNSEELPSLSSEEIERCLYSLCDYNTHIKMFCQPCEIMIQYLKSFYDPNDRNSPYSLSIETGKQGSRLTHSHSRQYMYVLQTLYLWREIGEHMFFLWTCAENDMLDLKNPYRLIDTGQGLNRMQSGHTVLGVMRKILHNVQKKVGGWVGSSMIHMGDTNIPNTFMFIDKYTQVPRILNPIVLCLQEIDELYESTPAMKNYINTEFNGAHNLKMMITCDFFRHGFDGSGGDNFNEAGSCIDGRLTSAWNWCSKIEKKKYFPIFLLTGFVGFDGTF